MSDGKRKAAEKAGHGGSFHEKRSYERFRIPAVYQRYISLRVRKGEAFMPAVLLNFSRHGVMFESAEPYGEGASAECVISAPKLLSRDIAFSLRVKYCKPGSGSYEIGAEIENPADATWFDIFMEVHDFVVARKGDIY